MITNTFPGFGSMVVRNTNVVTMSSLVVMTQCIFHEKRSGENRNKIMYVLLIIIMGTHVRNVIYVLTYMLHFMHYVCQ